MRTSIEVTISEVEESFIVSIKSRITKEETYHTFRTKEELTAFLTGFYM
jgi:1,2-phenylacetyl-CoA epoxidase catalytic subunit